MPLPLRLHRTGRATGGRERCDCSWQLLTLGRGEEPPMERVSGGNTVLSVEKKFRRALVKSVRTALDKEINDGGYDSDAKRKLRCMLSVISQRCAGGFG